MLKYALLAGAMTIAAPALAQSTMTSPQTAPTATTGAADPSMSPAQTAPGQDATCSVRADPVCARPDRTGDATRQQRSGRAGHRHRIPDLRQERRRQAQRSRVRGLDGRPGRPRPIPATKPGTPETKKWVAAAFAQADTDKNKSLSKPELTSFHVAGLIFDASRKYKAVGFARRPFAWRLFA